MSYQKKIIKYEIILFSILSIVFINGLYSNLRFARNMKNVSIVFYGNNINYSEIIVERISPENNNDFFIREKLTNDFFYLKNGYFKKIHVVLNKNNIENIKEIKVSIGEKIFLFTINDFIENWKYKENDEFYFFQSPSEVRYDKSLLPNFDKVINWPGDFYVFVRPLFFYLLFFILLNLIFITYYKMNTKYNYINEIDNYKIIEHYNIIYWGVFFIIIFIGFIQRMTINHLPYLTGDAGGYLGPACEWFDTGKFIHVDGRSFIYPLFVLLVLRIFNDFTCISLIQHVIGLLTGFFIIIMWKDFFKLLKINNKFKLIHDFMGFIVLSLFIFSQSIVVYENYIIREAIYPLFLVLHILCLVKFLNNIKNNDKYIYLWGILFIVSSYFIFVYQPRWGFTLIFDILVYSISFYIINRKFIEKVIFLIFLPLIISFCTIYCPENILIKNETSKESFLPMHLFFGHAKIIDIELEKDISNPNFDKYDKDILINIRNAFKEDFNTPQTKHTYLGYDFNRLAYSGWINNYLHSKMTNKSYQKFCRYYFIRSVLDHPFLYFKKIILELSQFYNFKGADYTQKVYKFDPEGYESVYDKLNWNAYSYLPYKIFTNASYILSNSIYDRNELIIDWVESIIFLLSRIYLITMLLFLALFFRIVLKKILNKQSSNSFFNYYFLLLLLLYNFFISLTIASIYTYDVSRYFDDQFVLIIISQIIVIEYIFILFFEKIKSVKLVK